jgi:hypothetical protein
MDVDYESLQTYIARFLGVSQLCSGIPGPQGPTGLSGEGPTGPTGPGLPIIFPSSLFFSTDSGVTGAGLYDGSLNFQQFALSTLQTQGIAFVPSAPSAQLDLWMSSNRLYLGTSTLVMEGDVGSTGPTGPQGGLYSATSTSILITPIESGTVSFTIDIGRAFQKEPVLVRAGSAFFYGTITSYTPTTGSIIIGGITGIQGSFGTAQEYSVVVNGLLGATGGTGETGPSGAGPAGPTGATGFQGVGPTGATGDAAAEGATGTTGPAGSFGPTGPAGPSNESENGPTGFTGPAGVGGTGATGSTGPVGPTGSGTSSETVGGTGTALSTTASVSFVQDGWHSLGTGTNGAVKTIINMNPTPVFVPLGTGVTGQVNAAVYGNDGTLYVGGTFTSGAFNTRIAQWNGSAWSNLPILNNTCRVLKIGPDGFLYAGGDFGTAGGVTVNGIARWDGSSWTALGSGLGVGVYSLAFSGSTLYAGGSFTSPSTRIAMWNGSSWSSMGTLGNTVQALTIGTDGTVYAGLAGTTSTFQNWTGAAWAQVGATALTGAVTSLLTGKEGNIYVGGSFNVGNFIRFAYWNGVSLVPILSGTGGVTAMALSEDGHIYVSGVFAPPTGWFSGVSASRIARFTGTDIRTLGTIEGTEPLAIAISSSGEVMLGGNFTSVNGVTFASPRVALYKPMTIVGTFSDKSVNESAIVLYRQNEKVKCMWYENAWIVMAR